MSAMENYDKIKKRFTDTPAPCIYEGRHRAHLKGELIESMRSKDKKMMNWKNRMAWACGLMLILAATAWSGQKLYKVFITESQTNAHYESPHVIKLKEMEEGHIVSIKADSISYDPKSLDKIEVKGNTTVTSVDVLSEDTPLNGSMRGGLITEVMRQLRSGHAKLLRVEMASDGSKTYVYNVMTASGKEIEYKSKMQYGGVSKPTKTK
jgi:hypothetical protein